jgi:hypothetical protein
MRDYLGRLAARSLNSAALLRPNLPSLFEPFHAVTDIFSTLDREMPSLQVYSYPGDDPAGIASLQPQRREGHPEGNRASEEMRRSQPSPMDNGFASDVLCSTDEQNSHIGESGESFQNNMTIPQEEERAAMITQIQIKSRHHPEEQELILKKDPQAIQGRPSHAQISAEMSESEIITPYNPAKIKPLNAPADIVQDDDQEEARSLIAKIEPFIASSHNGQDHSALPAKGIKKPSVRTEREMPDAESSSKSRSTVKVSIGRIEVRSEDRAIPQPQRRSVPAPSLSLDEYLKRRNEGQL